MTTSGALCRSLYDTEVDKSLEKTLLDYHVQLNHRKSIKEDLRKLKIEVSQQKLHNILEKCIKCAQRDKKGNKHGGYIHIKYPGETVSCDLLELTRVRIIINLIDFFSRKLFSKYINGKNVEQIIEFLDKVHKELNIRTLLTDNGTEFKNNKIGEWVNSKEIVHKFTIPYNHPSNGRIEGANITLRNAIIKTKNFTKDKLDGIVEAYVHLR